MIEAGEKPVMLLLLMFISKTTKTVQGNARHTKVLPGLMRVYKALPCCVSPDGDFTSALPPGRKFAKAWSEL